MVRYFTHPLLSLLLLRTLSFLNRLLRLQCLGPRQFLGEPWALLGRPALSNLFTAIFLPMVLELQLQGLNPLVCELLVWVPADG